MKLWSTTAIVSPCTPSASRPSGSIAGAVAAREDRAEAGEDEDDDASAPAPFEGDAPGLSWLILRCDGAAEAAPVGPGTLTLALVVQGASGALAGDETFTAELASTGDDTGAVLDDDDATEIADSAGFEESTVAAVFTPTEVASTVPFASARGDCSLPPRGRSSVPDWVY